MSSCPNGFAPPDHTKAVSVYSIHHIGPAQGGIMLSSGIIDLAIGLAFVFGVAAALASVITELISRFLGLRGAYLLKGLRELLDGTGVEAVVNEADRDYDAMRGLVTGSIPAGTDVKIPVGPPPPTADATPPAPGTSSPTTPDASTKPARPVQMRAMSATGALLGSPILRSQGMTGDIFDRDLVLKASRFGPGVTGGSWRKPRLGARRGLPSYISAKSFGEAVIDLLVPDAAGRTTMTTIQDSLKNLPADLPFTTSLQSLATNAANDISRFSTSIENWYDDHMDRVSGWYKRHVAKITFVVGAILVILLNLNTITIGRTLYSNSVVSSAVSMVAASHPNCATGESQEQCLSSLQTDLSAVAQAGLPIGWPTVSACLVKGASCNWWQQRGILNPNGSSGWQLVLVIIGFLLTILALTPGAQFWFGLLVKLGAIRSTGPKPPTPAPAATTNTVVTLSPEAPSPH
jgi:hypothetical protein